MPRDLHETKTKRAMLRGHRGLLLAVLTLLVGAAVAYADFTSVDMDVTDTDSDNNIVLADAAPGATVSGSASIVIRFQGGQHLASGTSVEYFNDPTTGGTNLPSGYTVGSTSIAIPASGWDATSDYVTATVPFTFTAPTTPGEYNYKIRWSVPTAGYACRSGSSCLNGQPMANVKVTVVNPDADGDGVNDGADNCPTTSNAGQADADADGVGDVCDPDRDGDGVANGADNCADVPNPGQADNDGDALGDACDPDDDNDGVNDGADNCPTTSNAGQADADGVGDVCDPDRDGDGVANGADNCADVPNSDQADADADGVGDACDPDRDGDGVLNGDDNCADVSNSDQHNNDGDALGDACDPDDDNDGVADTTDNCPTIANASQEDNDADGLGRACDSNDFAPALGDEAVDAAGDEGDTLTASGSFTDGDGNDTLTITQVSGAGTVTDNGDGTWSWSLPTTDDGSGSVTVAASDGEHAAVEDSFDWQASNVAPTATPDAPASVDEGTSFTLSLSDVVDPGSDDTHTFAFDCGDGVYVSGAAPSRSCTTSDDAMLAVRMKVTDDDGGATEYTDTVEVRNVVPGSVTASFGPASLSCAAATNATLGWSFTDPGADTWSAQVDWENDGTFEASYTTDRSGSATHAYGSAGSHTAAIKILDDDGGVSAVKTATVVVNYNLSSILQPVNDTRNGQPTSMFKYGSTVPVKVEITDCDGSHPANLDVRVTYAMTSSAPPPVGTDEAVATNAPDGGNRMRFSDPIYIFNFGTRAVTDPSSTLRIDVSIPATGQFTYAHIGLKAK